MNLQDGKLFRLRDKRLDWSKLKKVSVLPDHLDVQVNQ